MYVQTTALQKRIRCVPTRRTRSVQAASCEAVGPFVSGSGDGRVASGERTVTARSGTGSGTGRRPGRGATGATFPLSSFVGTARRKNTY